MTRLPNAHPKPRRKPKKVRKPLKRSPVTRGKKIKRFARLREPKLLAYVRTLPCILRTIRVTGGPCEGITEAAHLKSRGAGGADKFNVIPLCTKHHREQHRIGIQSFAAKYVPGWIGVADPSIVRWAELQLIAVRITAEYGRITADGEHQ